MLTGWSGSTDQRGDGGDPHPADPAAVDLAHREPALRDVDPVARPAAAGRAVAMTKPATVS